MRGIEDNTALRGLSHVVVPRGMPGVFPQRIAGLKTAKMLGRKIVPAIPPGAGGLI